jgi:hypothetical protein
MAYRKYLCTGELGVGAEELPMRDNLIFLNRASISFNLSRIEPVYRQSERDSSMGRRRTVFNFDEIL